MSETTTELTQEEQYQAMLQQLLATMDPMDLMKPGQREIAKLTLNELTVEHDLVQRKLNTRSRQQRDFIVSRWEYEQANPPQQETLPEAEVVDVTPKPVKVKKLKKIEDDQK
jgi:fructose-1-phosphate kinase PfkB-like protein